jgi:tripeptidyl-peptidase II
MGFCCRVGAFCVLQPYSYDFFGSRLQPLELRNRIKMANTAPTWDGLLPKRETQAYQFVQEHPEYDGRGIVVGILDTGVDPAAEGLSVCPDGRPKVIDVVDCSGSGDVKMSDEIEVKEGCVGVPSSGKTVEAVQLKVNPEWLNPTGKYRYGIKRLWDFYSRTPLASLKKNREEKFTEQQRVETAKLQRALAVAEGTIPLAEGEVKEDIEDCKAKLALLKSLASSLDDDGPPMYCLTWHDGSRFQAAVDSSGTGDFSNIECMTDYNVSRQYKRFTEIDALTYAVNIFDHGTVLSIVCDAGAHGTHVAGIVAAYHPDDATYGSGSNGVAPGAQIISLKIGDSRLGSMEVGPALCRAMLEAKRRGCHIINMSYGEATAWEDTGYFVKLANELVNKHGIVFCASAGNNGPALSTVGCPGGTTSAIMSIGAYAVSSLMSVGYHISDKDAETLSETNYTWSSMGPSLDGDLGVSIMAPGGAVAPVPHWTKAKNQLMNGTSMSSPNATGCIALLLCAARTGSHGMNAGFYSPIHIRRVVERTAKMISGVDRLGQGHGLIQVQDAWKDMETEFNCQLAEAHVTLRNVAFNVSIKRSGRTCRGLYLRQPHETTVCNTWKVEVQPQWAGETDDTPANEKIHFEHKVVLKLVTADGAAYDWITHTDRMLIVNSSKMVTIKIDPRDLPSGHYSASVCAYLDSDPTCINGPIFEIPITVVKPVVITPPAVGMNDGAALKYNLGSMTFGKAERIRHFIAPPAGCQYIDAVIRDTRDGSDENGGPDASSRMLCFHELQTLRGVPYRDYEHQQYLQLKPGSVHVVSFPVKALVTAEITLAPFWHTLGDTKCSVELTFRGVNVSPSKLCIEGGCRVAQPIDIVASLHDVNMDVSGSLNAIRTVYKPSALGSIVPLGERDVYTKGERHYALNLSYEFEQSEATKTEAVCKFPGCQGILYESRLHSQFFTVFNPHGKVIAVGDSWPDKMSLTCKGKYKVNMQLRCQSLSVLEGLNDMPLVLERTLSKKIDISAYFRQCDAFIGGAGKIGTATLPRGENMRVFFKEPSYDSLPKFVVPGDVLSGTVRFMATAALDGVAPNDKNNSTAIRLHGYNLTYLVGSSKPPKAPDADKVTSKDSSKKESKKKNEEDPYVVAIRDAKIKYLKSLIGKKGEKKEDGEEQETALPFLALYKKLSAEFPENLLIEQAMLSYCCKEKANLSSNKDDTISEEHIACDAVIIACDNVLKLIDSAGVAMELGLMAPDKDDSERQEKRKKADTDKTALIEAYSACAHAQLWKWKNTEDSDAKAILYKAFEKSTKDLQNWEDINAEKHWYLQTQRLVSQGKMGLALKKVQDTLAKLEKGDSVVSDENCQNMQGGSTKDDLLLLRQELLSAKDNGLNWAHLSERAVNKAVLLSAPTPQDV